MHGRRRGKIGPPVSVYWNGKWQLADVLWSGPLGTLEVSLRLDSRIEYVEADHSYLRLTDDWVGWKVKIYSQKQWRSAWVGQVRRNGLIRLVRRDGLVEDNVVLDDGLQLITEQGGGGLEICPQNLRVPGFFFPHPVEERDD